MIKTDLNLFTQKTEGGLKVDVFINFSDLKITKKVEGRYVQHEECRKFSDSAEMNRVFKTATRTELMALEQEMYEVLEKNDSFLCGLHDESVRFFEVATKSMEKLNNIYVERDQLVGERYDRLPMFDREKGLLDTIGDFHHELENFLEVVKEEIPDLLPGYEEDGSELAM
ncbi:hypothetical protein [uncultured Enterococcus sp.]|uniref:hypothetical protein n=1 Tax=uncultured Enterococcus sp. TaxID=167972 RepID=UPI002AA640C6|nr:hypothetical protein [uncultured Enterococcus sp.]